MREAEVKRIALFFFFITLDESAAIAMATHAYSLYFKKSKTSPPALHPAGVDWQSTCLVWATNQIWLRQRNKFKRGRPQISKLSNWNIETNLDLGPWKEFQKNSSEEELLCVTWNHLLNLKENEISAGLSVNTGTVRYRVGRGLKRLGTYDQRSQPTRLEVVK